MSLSVVSSKGNSKSPISRAESGKELSQPAVEVEVSELDECTTDRKKKCISQRLRAIFHNKTIRQGQAVFVKFCRFTGPGTIISVAYVDPDNFQTALSSGAQFKFRLLFMVLVANIIAVYLQVGFIRNILLSKLAQ